MINLSDNLLLPGTYSRIESINMELIVVITKESLSYFAPWHYNADAIAGYGTGDRAGKKAVEVISDFFLLQQCICGLVTNYRNGLVILRFHFVSGWAIGKLRHSGKLLQHPVVAGIPCNPYWLLGIGGDGGGYEFK